MLKKKKKKSWKKWIEFFSPVICPFPVSASFSLLIKIIKMPAVMKAKIKNPTQFNNKKFIYRHSTLIALGKGCKKSYF